MNWVDTNLSRLVNFHYIVEFMALGAITGSLISAIISETTNLLPLQKAGLLSAIVVFIVITWKIRNLRNKQLEEIKKSIKEEWSGDISKETLETDQKEKYSHYTQPTLNQIERFIEQQAQHFKSDVEEEHKATQDKLAKSQIQVMEQSMATGIHNLHNKIPLKNSDFTLATKFGKSINYLARSVPHQILDDEWQSDDPSDTETYVSEADARAALEDFEKWLTEFTLVDHDGESHHELSQIVSILKNQEKYLPCEDDPSWDMDLLIELIQEAADITGWWELEKIINRIDLKQFTSTGTWRMKYPR